MEATSRTRKCDHRKDDKPREVSVYTVYPSASGSTVLYIDHEDHALVWQAGLAMSTILRSYKCNTPVKVQEVF